MPAGRQASAHPSPVVPRPGLALQPSQPCDELPNSQFSFKTPFKKTLIPYSLEAGSLRSGAPGLVPSAASLLVRGRHLPHVFPPSPQSVSYSLLLRTHQMETPDSLLTKSPLQRPTSTAATFEVLGFGASPYGFGGGTVQPIPVAVVSFCRLPLGPQVRPRHFSPTKLL